MTDTLRDEIALRERSIADAEREFADGELSADELSAVVLRESEAIARCRVRLAAVETPSPAPRAASATTRRHRRAWLVVALVCFLAAVGAVLVSNYGPRAPGSSDTGTVITSTDAKIAGYLVDAEVAEVNGEDTTALTYDNDVLMLDPRNIEALTQSGWLTFTAGSASHTLSVIELGEDRVHDAVTLAPTDPDCRLYYAIIAASTPHDAALAVSQFRTFLRLTPTVTELAIARPWLVRLKIPVTP